MNLMNKFWVLFFIGILFLFSGCTMVLVVDTEPPGAKVFLDGNYVGETPLRTQVESIADGIDTPRTIDIKKDGFKIETIRIKDSKIPTTPLSFKLKNKVGATGIDKIEKLKTITRTINNKTTNVSWRSPRNARLLVVGVGIFQDGSIQKLKNAAVDASNYSALILGSGVPNQNIIELFNEKATRSNITDAIVKIKMATTKRAETAIIYFSGHGAPIVKNGKIVDAVLVPYDARENSLEYTGIKLSTLREMLSDVRGNWIVILDACFSGKEGRSLMAKNVKAIVPVPKNFSVAPKPKRNTWWITATSGDNFANDFPKENSGLFTHYFLRALNGERGVDINEDGLISLAEVFKWTKKEVKAVSAKSLGRLQVPELIGKGDTILTIPR